MTINEIKNFLIEEGFEENELKPETSFTKELHIDSTEMVDLCLKLGSQNNVKIKPYSFDNILELQKIMDKGEL